jgi:hypothetical protein
VIGGADLEQQPSLQGVEAVLIIGANWQGVVDIAAPADTTTTSAAESPTSPTTLSPTTAQPSTSASTAAPSTTAASGAAGTAC